MSGGGPLEHGIDEYAPALAPVFERHGVVLAYLYGSQARGDAGPLSDVDVGVLFPADLDAKAMGALREFVDTQPLRDLRRQYLLERIGQGRMGQYARP